MKIKRFLSVFIIVLMLANGYAVFAAGDDDLIMSNCDTSVYWAANSQGADALETDTVNKTEGGGSVGATAINGKLNQIVFAPDTAMDVSGYKYLEFDIYFNDLTWFSDCGSVMIELTSSGTCDQESNRYMKKVIRSLLENGAIEGKQNWWHFVLELDEPQGTANGKLDKSNFNYFRFYTVDPITTTPDYTVRIDNMRFTNNPENYTPPEKEDEGVSSEVPKPYEVKRADANADSLKKIESMIFFEKIALGVAGVLMLAVAVLLVISKVRKSKGEKKHD